MSITGAYGRLMTIMKRSFPGLNERVIKNLISEVRNLCGGSLTGLLMTEIVKMAINVLKGDKKVFPAKYKRKQSGRKNKGNIFKCQKCSKSYKHKVSLKRHSEKHKDEEATFSCADCGKFYKRRDTLDKHKRIVHKRYNMSPSLRTSSNNNFVCKMCGLEFGNDVQDYENHLVLKVCQQKGEKFKLNKQLRVQCNVCEKSYKEIFCLKRHIKQKHTEPSKNDGEHKDVPGDEVQQEPVHRGASINVKEERRTCPICYRRFFNRSSRDRHVKNVHVEKMDATSSKITATDTTCNNSENVESVFKCDICDKSYPDHGSLMKHRDWKHRKTS